MGEINSKYYEKSSITSGPRKQEFSLLLFAMKRSGKVHYHNNLNLVVM